MYLFQFRIITMSIIQSLANERSRAGITEIQVMSRIRVSSPNIFSNWLNNTCIAVERVCLHCKSNGNHIGPMFFSGRVRLLIHIKMVKILARQFCLYRIREPFKSVRHFQVHPAELLRLKTEYVTISHIGCLKDNKLHKLLVRVHLIFEIKICRIQIAHSCHRNAPLEAVKDMIPLRPDNALSRNENVPITRTIPTLPSLPIIGTHPSIAHLLLEWSKSVTKLLLIHHEYVE